MPKPNGCQICAGVDTLWNCNPNSSEGNIHRSFQLSTLLKFSLLLSSKVEGDPGSPVDPPAARSFLTLDGVPGAVPPLADPGPTPPPPGVPLSIGTTVQVTNKILFSRTF